MATDFVEQVRDFLVQGTGVVLLVALVVRSAMGLRLCERYNLHAKANNLKPLPEYRLRHSIAYWDFSKALSRISVKSLPDKKLKTYIFVFRVSENIITLAFILLAGFIILQEPVRQYIEATWVSITGA